MFDSTCCAPKYRVPPSGDATRLRIRSGGYGCESAIGLPQVAVHAFAAGPRGVRAQIGHGSMRDRAVITSKSRS